MTEVTVLNNNLSLDCWCCLLSLYCIVFALSWVLLCHHHETATDDKQYALGLYDLGIVQFVSTNLNKEFFWRILRRNSMT